MLELIESAVDYGSQHHNRLWAKKGSIPTAWDDLKLG